LKQDEAKRRIASAFHDWCADNGFANSVPSGSDAHRFYLKLEKEKSSLLAFRCSGDKWQRVHGWLLQAKLVSD